MSSSYSALKRAAEDAGLPLRYPKQQRFDPTSPLCEGCQQLDLDAAFENALSKFKAVREGRLKRPEELEHNAGGTYFYIDAIFAHGFGDRLARDSTCPLCTFFRSMRIQPGRHERYKLLAFPSSESWLWRTDVLRESPAWADLTDTAFMAVVPDLETLPVVAHEEHWMVKDIPRTGVIYRLRADEDRNVDADILVRPKELQPEANLALARDWLALCHKHHSRVCGKRGHHQPVERGFRLIDCLTDPPRVEPHPWGTRYAALSYVWGISDADKADWPKTVLDAVAVTKEMGLRYIWVDRLCINQSDENEKLYLISKMTTIYEEAELTIVAAAGSGAAHGLPGIRSTPRTQQPSYTLDSGSVLLSSLRDARYDIYESDYWTRGWTYQEGVLSNRRLVFTPNQIYWECRNMAAQESMAIPLLHQPSSEEEEDEEEADDNLVMADFMITGIFKGDAYTGGFLSESKGVSIPLDEDDYRIDYGFPLYLEASTRAQLRGLNEHIRAYSKRRLTYDSDALPAFMGITGMYKRTADLHLLYGLPLWLGTIAGVHSGPQITFALTVSAWYHRSGQHSTFVSESSCRRRTHLLPSWSWAGWTGAPVTWRALPNNEHCAQMADLIDLPDQPYDRERNRLLWAADTYLYHQGERGEAIRLRDPSSADRLRCLDQEKKKTLIGLHNHFVLKYFIRHEQTQQRKWTWVRMAGRVGRHQRYGESCDWVERCYRIAGRLCYVYVSDAMSEQEWTAKHASGEIISVLMFAGRYLAEENTGHGGARFLTLRRVEGAEEETWERVGTLFLTIPKVSLDKCADNEGLLKEIPVRKRQGIVVIQ
ncbi:heterokaryon incompatibility protein-domain-containing protein [Chaetomium strumarium]|uniref:Heterokaryon incompatibility protein-domain-containing protein n=1 Tax=Chaetomium strumarium TaxID=1170767 RepID=A0AAJ0GL33_9PEZI|nr:heterokaryon incompatibility protein-domain-containing protein [Chaetomium strumarium]